MRNSQFLFDSPPLTPVQQQMITVTGAPAIDLKTQVVPVPKPKKTGFWGNVSSWFGDKENITNTRESLDQAALISNNLRYLLTGEDRSASQSSGGTLPYSSDSRSSMVVPVVIGTGVLLIAGVLLFKKG